MTGATATASDGTGAAGRVALIRLAENYQNQRRLVAVLEERIRRLQTSLGQSTETIDIYCWDSFNPMPAVPASKCRSTLPDRCRPARWPCRKKVALRPTAGSFNYALNTRCTRVIGFDVSGCDRATLGRILDEVTRRQAQLKSFSPLFIYDGGDFDLFRHYGFVFERLPSQHNRLHRSEIDWRTETARRLAGVCAKWSLEQIIDMRGEQHTANVPHHQLQPVLQR
jgi:hypothetical protein